MIPKGGPQAPDQIRRQNKGWRTMPAIMRRTEES
jgi:hypothetical protein